MFLNGDNKKIAMFLLSKDLINLHKSFLELLGSGYKFDKIQLKMFLKMVRADQVDLLQEKLLEILSSFDILISPGLTLKSSSKRVKKYRDQKKAQGFKSISLQIAPDTYQKLKELKRLNSMTYSEIITFLVNSQ